VPILGHSWACAPIVGSAGNQPFSHLMTGKQGYARSAFIFLEVLQCGCIRIWLLYLGLMGGIIKSVGLVFQSPNRMKGYNAYPMFCPEL